MQARDVMTRTVVTVGPATSAKLAAELMAARGFAALPVVDEDGRLVGVVAEADVLRDRLPADPRLHLRRDGAHDPHQPGLLVGDVMTTAVRTSGAGDDVADLARLFVDEHLRSVPVLDGGGLVGIVSRRDLLSLVSRPDEAIRRDVLGLVEAYTGDLGCWDVEVVEGIATVARAAGTPQVSPEVEEVALQRLAATVPGVTGLRVGAGAGGTRRSTET